MRMDILIVEDQRRIAEGLSVMLSSWMAYRSSGP